MWDQIRSNQRRSVLVVGLMGALLVATGVALGAAFLPTEEGLLTGGTVALFVWLVMWIVSVRQGDDVLLRMANAHEIRKEDHPQLVNVVEEMAIASALPDRPRVFIVDDPSPNAFAVGRDPRKAAVAVTTGLLRILDRDELQGVVAHEIAHVRNRDVALVATTAVMLGSIVLLAEVGLRVLWYGGGGRRSRPSGRRDGGGQAIFLAVAIVFLVLAPIFAQLIYFALSRRREYLADASAAMFTRYPDGLASALEKLGAGVAPLADESRVTAPMYIVRPVRAAGKGASLFSTHPPLEERVRILRSMAGGAGLPEYEKASREVRGRGVVGARTLAGASSVTKRAPAAAEPVASRERARAASDALLSAAGYERRPCPSCGAVLKVPPALGASLERCPRCGGGLGGNR